MRTVLALSFQEDKAIKGKRKILLSLEEKKKKFPGELFPVEEAVGDKAVTIFRNGSSY